MRNNNTEIVFLRKKIKSKKKAGNIPSAVCLEDPDKAQPIYGLTIPCVVKWLPPIANYLKHLQQPG